MKMYSKMACVIAAAGLIAAVSGTESRAAGQGGVAGAASFQLDGFGNVLEASAAVAVGKSTAYAGAETTALVPTSAFSAGTGGVITFTGTSIYIQSIAEDAQLGTAQANDLTGNTVNIDAALATVDIVNP